MNYRCAFLCVLGIGSNQLVADDLPSHQEQSFSQMLAHNAAPMAMALALPVVSRFAVDRTFGYPHYRAHIITLALSSALLAWRYDFSLLRALVFSSLVGISTHALGQGASRTGKDVLAAGGGSVGMLAFVFFLNMLKSVVTALAWNPFYQQIIVINESGQPLTLLADTPCDGSDSVWRMSYPIPASKNPYHIVLSEWHFNTAEKDRFQQEKLCFYRSRSINDYRWMPYPHVDHIRFVIADTLTKKVYSDSCLLPLKPAGMLHAYPVYIVRKNGGNLEVYLKHYVYGMIKPVMTWSIVRTFLESSLTEERIEPVRSCKP